jgi:predicted ATPase/class 3 adenylate cyclase
MRRDLPSGTVTFLFTDVEGSTKLLHELGAEAYAGALAEHRRLIREACAAEGGVEVDTQGDAFFFAFPTAPGALAAASAFTEALALGPIQVRVGLHTGTPLLTEEGYVGDDVHFAARVAATSHGGQVVCSQATAALVEIPLASLGSHRLKDVSEPVSIYQLGDGSFPPLKTIANTNLPTSASSFLGREEELYAADVLLQQARLLTISGPGGQGKTRFALELAKRAREERFSDYQDGVFSCFLSSLRDPALVLPTIAQIMNVKEQPGSSALDVLSQHLQGKKLLLLLDNAEHLLDAASELSQLLQRAEGLTLLVTSRELLRIHGERAYSLPPLAEAEGVALFCERARRGPSAEIAELCARLEGLPLAIELAAARTAILTPDQLLERLSQRLDLLKGGRDADPRQQTLRATIDWSHDLLTEDEQRLFRSLSVFAGGCTLEAAERVCDADLDALQSLVDKSLLRFTEGRFWMLETIREYAAEGLAHGEWAERATRHLEFFTELAYQLRVPAREQEEWALETLRDEQANVLGALTWAIETLAVERAQKLLEGAWFYWLTRGLAAEGDSWAATVAALPSPPTLHRGWALVVAGEFPRYRGDPERSEALKRQAIEVFEALGPADPRVAGSLAATLSDASEVASDLDEAESYASRALDIREQLGDPGGISHALHAKGIVARRRGLLDDAARLFAESARIDRERGDEAGAAEALCDLAVVLRAAGDHEAARRAVDAGYGAAVESGDRYLSALARVARGLLLADEGAFDEAVRLLEGATTELREAGLALPPGVEREVASALASSPAAIGRPDT